MDLWYLISQWMIRVVMVPVVAHRHSPSAALAWLVFIYFMPWVGLVLYLFIGVNILTKRRIKSYRQRLREIDALNFLSMQKPHIFRLPSEPHRFPLVQLTERLAGMPVLHGNSVEIMVDGCRVVDKLVEDIDAAQHHVHLLFYIFEDDKVGHMVGEAMMRAAARGVQCRLLVDAFGSRSLSRSFGPQLAGHGIELYYLMPINPFRRHLTRIDLRNHRKLAIIDGTVAYTGSQNIENHSYDHHEPEDWHDMMVRVCGPAVLQLQLVFLEDWYFASDQILEGPDIFPVPPIAGDVPVQAFPSNPVDSVTALRNLLVSAINESRQHIIITSPYFIPDETFMTALHLALLRGVKVDIVIPMTADHPVVGAVARAYLDQLIDYGITIHFHRGILHAKTMSVDDSFALIGTANFDRRSFYLSFELSLLFYGPEVTGQLRARQGEYMEQSRKMDRGTWKRSSRAQKTLNQTLKLLSPIL